MRGLLAAIVATSAALVVAQSAGDIPQCALGCFVDNVQKTSGCELTDFPCQCEPATQMKLNSVIAPCVLAGCPTDDAIKTNDVVQGICKNALGDSASSSGGMSSMGSMTPSGTMSNGVSATFTSLGSVGVLGGGAQATGSPEGGDPNVSLNGGVGGSTTSMSATMSAGPQVAYFTAGAVPAIPTRLAAAVGGLAGVVGVLAI